MAPPISSERDGGRSSCCFHAAVVVSMSAAFLTYFLLVPIVPLLASRFGISAVRSNIP